VVIFGWRVLWRPVGNGVFHCARCGGDRQFQHLVGRRWFHLFFIPLIPLAQAGQHVRCTVCGTRYRMEVLKIPTTAQMQVALPNGMRAAAVAMLRAAGGGGEPARRRAVDAIRSAGLADYQYPALDADLSASLMSPQPGPDLARILNSLAIQLAVPAREWFLAEVVRIGLADGPLSDDERRAVHEIAAQLGMSHAQAHGVIAVTEEGAQYT
jgi:zinc-ribbon family/Tellurite resistance protein TerB